MLSKKLQEMLFGKVSHLEGGTPVVARLCIPSKDGWDTNISWDGNKGLMFELLKRIEELECETRKLGYKVEDISETKKKKKKKKKK